MDYKFYIQGVDKDGTVLGQPVSLEEQIPGLKYVKCAGIESVGAPKNIYTEDYPEADGLRVYHPSDSGNAVTRKETSVALTLAFVDEGGADHRASYWSFMDLVAHSRVYFWDTCRKKKMLLMLNKEVSPETDVVKGLRHIICTFNFTNLWGRAFPCDEVGNIIG